MEHVRSFSGFPGLDEMKEFLASQDSPLETSELYSSAHDAKIVDIALRQSQYRKFTDGKLFDLVDEALQWLNASDTQFVYQVQYNTRGSKSRIATSSDTDPCCSTLDDSYAATTLRKLATT